MYKTVVENHEGPCWPRKNYLNWLVCFPDFVDAVVEDIYDFQPHWTPLTSEQVGPPDGYLLFWRRVQAAMAKSLISAIHVYRARILLPSMLFLCNIVECWMLQSSIWRTMGNPYGLPGNQAKVATPPPSRLVDEQLFQLSRSYAVGGGKVQILFYQLVMDPKAT